MSVHAAEKPRRRGRKAIAIITALVLIPTAAFAAFILLKGFTGSVTTSSMSLNTSADVNSTKVLSSTDMTCAVSVANDKVNITATKALPGGTCDIQVGYMASGDATTLKAQKVTFTGDANQYVTAAFLPSYCGKVVGSTVSVPSTFQFRISVAPNAPMGQTWNAAGDAGISFVTADGYVPADCKTAA